MSTETNDGSRRVVEPSIGRPSTGEILAYLCLTGVLGTSDMAALEEFAPSLERIYMPAGATLARRGERADALFVVVHGSVQAVSVHADGSELIVNEVGPGEVVGELPLLTGGTRTETLSARSPVTLLKCPYAACRDLWERAPAVRAALTALARGRLQRSQLITTLAEVFGTLDSAALCDIAAEARRVRLPRGEVLCRQDESGDSLYIVISGRLTVTVADQRGNERVIAEIGRGETVGELAVLTGERRSATVAAVRDSVLVQFTKPGFARLLATYPQVGACTSRLLSRRLQRANPASLTRRGTIHLAVVPASPEVPLTAFVQRLTAVLAAFGATSHLSSASADTSLGVAGIAQAQDEHPNSLALASWLDEQEARCRFVCYEVDASASAWSRRCIEQADQVLIVAQAGADSEPGALETTLLNPGGAPLPVRRTLVLLHPDGSRAPVGTERWLAPRTIFQHYHLRWNEDADFGRLARCLAGRAVGLVLSGGGARAYAHLGVIRALREAGIPIDFIGGTSTGALIAAQYAQGLDDHTMCRQTRALFTSAVDYTVPIVALAAGRRPAKRLEGAFGSTRIEDLWIPYFCVSSNLTKAEVMVHRTGLLWQGVRASANLPGLFPPVAHQGDWLVDGAVLNNLPVDVMEHLCEGGTVMAVDVGAPENLPTSLADGEILSGWRVLWQTLNPFAARHRAPTILALLQRAAELGSQHQQQALMRQGLAALCFRPSVAEFDLLDFSPGETIADLGYQHAKQRIADWRSQTCHEQPTAHGGIRTWVS